MVAVLDGLIIVLNGVVVVSVTVGTRKTQADECQHHNHGPLPDQGPSIAHRARQAGRQAQTGAQRVCCSPAVAVKAKPLGPAGRDVRPHVCVEVLASIERLVACTVEMHGESIALRKVLPLLAVAVSLDGVVDCAVVVHKSP